LLYTTECATEVSFKLDGISDVKTINTSGAKGRSPFEGQLLLFAVVLSVSALSSICICAVIAKRFKSRSESKRTSEGQTEAVEKGTPVVARNAVDEWNPEGDEFWDADEKKPQQEDDNASTATPDASDTRSLPSLKADDFALDDSSISDRV